MRKTLIALAAAAVTLSTLGCAGQPVDVRPVTLSELPAGAKSLLTSGAEVTRVEELRYTKNTKLYRIHYTVAGREKIMHYNPASESTSTAVFEGAMPQN